jgi:hypothetical protein
LPEELRVGTFVCTTSLGAGQQAAHNCLILSRMHHHCLLLSRMHHSCLLLSKMHHTHTHTCLRLATTLHRSTVFIRRVGLNRTLFTYTKNLVLSHTFYIYLIRLIPDKIPYTYRTHMVLANPIHTAFLAGKSPNIRPYTVYIQIRLWPNLHIRHFWQGNHQIYGQI